MQASGRVLHKRATDWGPFKISPIFSQGRKTGWGAICGRHLDGLHMGSSGSCKKAVSLGTSLGLTDDVCVLRLKRWLISGLDDELWPATKRAKHVGMGGKHLAAFTHGLSESELESRLPPT